MSDRSSNPRQIVFGQPLMPDQATFTRLLETMYRSSRLSNSGPLHNQFESALARLYGGSVSLQSSGTMALMMALRLGNLPVGGEVITTPLSFAASVQAIDWCGLKPVFADVEPGFGTLCPMAVERAITPQTVAILAVHFQGIACDVDALQNMARRHGLWLVFDAAQAPDIQKSGESLCLWGDASAISLHATKLLNTAEGGAVITRDAGAAQTLSRLRNFGLTDGRMEGRGINGKMSELHAAFGLAVLPRLSPEMAARKQVRRGYDEGLATLPDLQVLRPRPDTTESHLYYTLRMPPDLRAEAIASLNHANILPRAPFGPLCAPGTPFGSAVIHSTADVAICADLARHYLSLPLHSDIGQSGIDRVTRAIRQVFCT